jgi:hypothetical protein
LKFIVDVFLFAVAAGLTAFTLTLCAEIPPARPDPGRSPCLVLHDHCDAAGLRDVRAADRASLVSLLAARCRAERIPAERIFSHAMIEEGCPCGGRLPVDDIAGEVRRALLRP